MLSSASQGNTNQDRYTINMIQSLYYKEWHKSRWTLLIIFLSFLGVILYSFINISQNLRVTGVDMVWDMIVQKGVYYFSNIKYLPLLAGILLALSQYVPEMTNKRLKLTLHLPLAESKIMLTMLSGGIISLAIVFILSYLTIYLGTRCYFPIEIAYWNATVTLPWLLGGITAYLLTAWVCLEPVWRQRVLNSIIAAIIITLFYFEASPTAYYPSMIYLFIITISGIAFSFYSLIRFKDGALF